MTIRPQSDLKAFFETGDRPTQAQFSDLIDSSAPDHFTTVAALLADTTASYPTGMALTAAGYRYTVAAPGASDHHLTTAGGVKLKVALPLALITPRHVGCIPGDAGAAAANTAKLQTIIRWALENRVNFVWDDQYYINGPVLYYDFVAAPKGHWGWEMSGGGGMILAASAAFQPIIELLATTGNQTHTASAIILRDFYIRQETRRQYDGHAIVVRGINWMTIDNLRIDGFSGHGLLCEAVWDSDITNNKVMHCGHTGNAQAAIALHDYSGPGGIENINSIYVASNHIEHAYWHLIEVGGGNTGGSFGGGAKHIRLIGNKTHYRNAISNMANIRVFGTDTTHVYLIGEQTAPIQEIGILIDAGASNCLVLGCQIGGGIQPIQIAADAGPGHVVSDCKFGARTGTYYVRNDSAYPVVAYGNTLPESEDPMTFTPMTKVEGALGGLTVLRGATNVPTRLVETRAPAAGLITALETLYNNANAVISQLRHTYSAGGVINSIVALRGLVAGSVADLLSIDAEAAVATIWVNKVVYKNGTFFGSGNGAPEGVLTAPRGSIWIQLDASGGTAAAMWLKETGAGSAGWVAK